MPQHWNTPTALQILEDDDDALAIVCEMTAGNCTHVIQTQTQTQTSSMLLLLPA